MSNIIRAAARSVIVSGRLNPGSAAAAASYLHREHLGQRVRSPPVVQALPRLELEVITIGQGVHVNRCERNRSWPGSPPRAQSPPSAAPAPPPSSSSSQGDCHMIAKKWHINEAPLQGSFLLLSPLKTIRWFEGGHGGSHLAQRSRGAHSSALRSPEAAAATVLAETPRPSSVASGANSQKPCGPGGAGRCQAQLRSAELCGARPRPDSAPGLRAGRDAASSSAIPDAHAQLGATLR